MEVRNLFLVFKNTIKVKTLIFRGDFKERESISKKQWEDYFRE